MRLKGFQESDISTEFQDNLAKMIKSLPNEEQAQVLIRIGAYPTNTIHTYNGFYYTLTATEKSEFLRDMLEKSSDISEDLGKKLVKYIIEENEKKMINTPKGFSRDMRLQKILVWMPACVQRTLGNFLGRK